jgi:hypothetical protein
MDDGQPPVVRLALAAAVLVVFVAAYAGTLSIVLHQAALLAQPGDRLVVRFSRSTPVDEALGRVGSAGTVLTGTRGMPWFYQVDVVEAAAGRRLAQEGWVLRVPQQPTLQGCFAVLSDRR